MIALNFEEMRKVARNKGFGKMETSAENKHYPPHLISVPENKEEFEKKIKEYLEKIFGKRAKLINCTNGKIEACGELNQEQ